MINPRAAISYGQNLENTGVSLYSPYGRICFPSMIGFWDVAVKVVRHGFVLRLEVSAMLKAKKVLDAFSDSLFVFDPTLPNSQCFPAVLEK